MARNQALDITNQGLKQVYTESKRVAFTGAAGLGAIGSVSLFTVTGDVRIENIVAICKEDLAGATATIAVGIAGNTAGLIASTTATDIDNGENWVDSAPATIEASIVGRVIPAGADIIATIATANITDGTIDFYIEFTPLSTDGDIRAA